MGFLPNNYKIPTVSDYMKFAKGKNKFRVLDSAIVGHEYWMDIDGKRVHKRKRIGEVIPMGEVGEGGLKHFWAFPVFNRENEKIQILQITQKSIMNAIKDLTKDDDWGDPKGYDLVVTRTGDGLDTRYSVMPSPKSEIDEGIMAVYEEMNINLDLLFSNGDPFSGDPTPKNEEVDPNDIPDIMNF